MAWTKSPQSLIDLFDKSVPPGANISRRKMFGYPAAFGVAAVLVACITPYGPESILVTLRIFGLGVGEGRAGAGGRVLLEHGCSSGVGRWGRSGGPV